MLASAHCDELVFDNPDVFDIHRPDVNQHTAFGKGNHMCLGAPLGRLELRVAPSHGLLARGSRLDRRSR